jgi:glycosyltransferase involved in cell wall biosynthesis
MSAIPEDVPSRDSLISVIIPALNEEELIGQAIDSALAGSSVEVIVADGGSRDRTFEIAAAKCVRVKFKTTLVPSNATFAQRHCR